MLEMITQAEVRRQLQDIKRIADDDESAHGSEDALHQEVLQAVADGHPDAMKLAKLALKTQDIRFARWCA